ncbi:MAG: ABC transporter ATP-binding protein/permease [Candidatus Adiutrix sp.]|jgi:ABC-type multidrug transport system fused ATPase/permease subunit|nr:ABC transporter ATP-binding protein/permease [Candidatus Adiutrix sp.]
MNFLSLPKLPRMVYQAFIKDGRRLYRLLPGRLRFGFWAVFFTQFAAAVSEICALLVISLFALSVAAPGAARSNVIIRPFLALSPALAEWSADPRRLVMFTSLLMAGFILFKVLLTALVSRRTTLFSEEVSLHIGRETLRRYLNKDYFWHLSPESPAVFHKFSLRAQLSAFLVALLLLYSHVFCCLALFASLFLAQPGLTLAVALVFSLGGLGTYLSLRRRLDRAGLKANALIQAEGAERQALLQGLREVLLYRREEVFFEKMAALMAAGKPVKAFQSFAGYLPAYVLEIIGFGTIALVTVVMLARGLPMAVIVSATSMLMLTAWRVLPAVSRTLGYAVAIRTLRPAAASCLELLETFIAEDPEPKPAPDPDFRFEKSLALEEAGFTYPGGREPALSRLSLCVTKGEKVGLIGVPGAGQSTLAFLMTGLVRARAGRFLVDGRELSPSARAAYVLLVGFVPQNPLLLQGTVADNVAFSQWGGEYDRRAAAEACRAAAADFVFGHPQGIDQPLGAGGRGLSGGQAQRVAIARALFAKPKIIIFDEATSALDQAGENLIAETIRRLAAGTTVVIIAHRLTTVENCDRLIWLDGGRVRDTGPPAKILPRYLAVMAERRQE